MNRINELRKKAQALPEVPGVYIMKDHNGDIIYIGKAKVLKNRVSQYFGSQNKHPVKVRRMVENVFDFDYIIVSSEYESLVLECNLIKQHMPKYNILLKDDKGYSYLKVTKNGWKNLSCVFQKNDDGSEYFGPYMSSDFISSALKEAADIYKLPHCNKQFPADISKKNKPCLNYHIKLCSGPCCGKVTQDEFNKNADDALSFIFGNKGEILSRYKKEMLEASENLEFEKAAGLRDKIKAIEKNSQKQNVVSLKHASQDVFGFSSIGNKSCFNILRIRDGRIINTENFISDRISEEEEFITVLANYYSAQIDFPDRICVKCDFAERQYFVDYIRAMAGKKVDFIHPKSGESANLLNMAEKNAAEKLSRVLSYNNRQRAVLYELQELLGLEAFPSVIEAYDISNLQGSNNVGGMVVYKDGRPSKKDYKRFLIKSFEGQDDFRSLAEVLERRIAEFNINKDDSTGFGLKPDLILLDGGAGQVSAVKEVFEKLNFNVPLFGMVKDGKHRTRAITAGHREITINDNRSVFTFVSEMQEEVHRYTIGYHRLLKNKNSMISDLRKINGIGEKRAKSLMIKFKSIENISNATVEELMTAQGINEQQAINVYNYFNEN